VSLKVPQVRGDVSFDKARIDGIVRAEDIRGVFDAADRHRAGRRVKETVTRYVESPRPLASWTEANIPEGLSVFKLSLMKIPHLFMQ